MRAAHTPKLTRSIAHNSQTPGRAVQPGHGGRGRPWGGANVRFVVLMARLEVTAPVPLGVTVAGEAVQVASAGKPAQARVTGEVNPDTELTLTVIFAVFPATTVPETGLMDKAKFAPPAPVRAITCGLLLALSIKVTVPIAMPVPVGV